MKTGPGELVLEGDNDYEGDARIEDGTLQLGRGYAGAISGDNRTVVVDNGATFDLNDSQFVGNSELGSLIVNDGTVESSFGSVRIAVTGLIEAANGSFSQWVDLDGTATMFVPPVAAEVTLSGEDVFTGTTIVAGGTLQEGAYWTSGLSNQSALVVEGGATIDLNGKSVVQADSVTLLDGNITNGTLAAWSFTLFSGAVSASLTGDSPLTVLADGTGNNTVVLSGDNTYTGGTTIVSGTLAITADSALGATTASPNVVFAGNGVLQWAASFSLSPQRSIQIDAGCTATIDTQSNRAGIPGNISGAGSLRTIGNGSLILSNSVPNTFSGGTFVPSATLVVASASGLPAGSSLFVGANAASLFAARADSALR